MKKCNGCNTEKSLLEFSKRKTTKDRLQTKCKSCQKKYQLANKEKLKEYASQYRLDNRAIINQYYSSNKEKLIENQKQYYLENKQAILSQKKQYHLDNKDKRNAYNRQYNLINKEKINNYIKQRKQINPLFKLRCNTRNLIYDSMKRQGYSKTSKTHKILGCDFRTFKAHLEKQFTKGMSWSNQGEWHLDHIYPVSLAKDEKHLIELNHYTNFQPLWAIDNLSKGNKIIEKQLFLL